MSNYAAQERAKWWPVPAELMAQYRDGSHTDKDRCDSLEWYQDSLRHRDGDRPAIIDADGTLEWWQKGKRHRDGDRPAIIDAYGTLEWCQNGLRHRSRDLPAYIGRDGALQWYQHNQCHRFGGPAVIYPSDKLECWYWRGEKIPVRSQSEFIEYLTLHRLIESEAL